MLYVYNVYICVYIVYVYKLLLLFFSLNIYYTFSTIIVTIMLLKIVLFTQMDNTLCLVGLVLMVNLC